MALFLIKEMLLLVALLIFILSSQVKEINIVFLCGVSDDGRTFKVPFSMKQVTVE